VSERRAHPRVKGPFEGWWDGAGRQSGRITDLSEGGCFVDSVSHPPAGQVVFISIAIGSGHIQLPAEVLYGESNQGFAVRFVDVPNGILEVLRQELERRLSG
jgi:PilZ domain